MAAIQDLTDASPRFLQACRAIHDAKPSALTAASYEGHVSGGGSEDTSTERIALNDDPAGAHEADRLVRHALETLHRNRHDPEARADDIGRAARTLWRITQVWAPHPPSEAMRRLAERANLVPDPGCEQHAKLAHWAPAHTVKPTTVGGNLPEPMLLCEPCYDFVRTRGKLPPGEWIEQHHRIGKAPLEHVVPGR
jgi:hypothetical protein